MKKVVCVLGSPRRHKNTETIARKLLESAERAGAETQIFVLNELDYKGCQACQACKTGAEECVVDDDLKQVLQAVSEADVVVLASPIYYGHVSGQMKSFVDRTYSYLVPDFLNAQNPSRLAPGKQCVFVLAQGDPDPSHFDIYPQFEEWFSSRYYGMKSYLIRGLGVGEQVDKQGVPDDLLRQAEDLGKRLAS